MNIGHRIKQLRKLHNTKANELAKTLDITPVYMSYLEKNNNQPSLDLLQKICNYFGITLAEFFAESELEISPELQELLNNAKKLDTVQLKNLNTFLKSLKEI